MRFLKYKGYHGSIEYDATDGLFFGQIQGIRSLISYDGATGPELESHFRQALDDYFLDCQKEGIPIEKPFKGSFNVRIPAHLHRDAALKAMEQNTSLNAFVSESIRAKLEDSK